MHGMKQQATRHTRHPTTAKQHSSSERSSCRGPVVGADTEEVWNTGLGFKTVGGSPVTHGFDRKFLVLK